MRTPMNKTIYIVTAIGVSIDTEVYSVTSYEKARDIVEDLKLKFLVENIDETCKDRWKGYSRYAQCNIEIQIHEEILKNA